MPVLIVVAGPNGSGKSTMTRMSVFTGVEIIDPDAIARGMQSNNRVQAARKALLARKSALGTGRSHLVETTLAGSGVLRHMAAARQEGFRIVLHYISVGSPEKARDRIRNRVAFGGHDISETDLKRRFPRSLVNLPTAIELSDLVLLYDNSTVNRPHRVIAVLGAHQLVPDWAVKALSRNL